MSYIQEVIAVIPPGSPLDRSTTRSTGGPSNIILQQQIDEIKAELALQPEYFLRWGLSTGALYAEEVQVNN